jgi:hypothetical protein
LGIGFRISYSLKNLKEGQMNRLIFLLSLIFIITISKNAFSQQLDIDQIELIKETTAAICDTVKDAKGTKTEYQLQGEIQAKLKGLAGKLANVGVEGKGNIGSESFEGLSREATASALEGDRGCRERVFNKMFDKLEALEIKPDQNSRAAVLDPYNHEWRCDISVEDKGKQLAGGTLDFGKVTTEPKMAYARAKFSSRRTRRLSSEIEFDSGAWSLGWFGQCLEGECMGFIDKSEPYNPVFLINRINYDEDMGRIEISGVVMVKEHGKHTNLGLLHGICTPK